MRILADENFPWAIVDALRKRGHDVLWARTDLPGGDDESILRRSRSEERLLVTLDKDFGELAFHRGMPAGCGVVLMRMRFSDPRSAASTMTAVLESRDDWTGNFSVIDENGTRMRPLPSEPPKT